METVVSLKRKRTNSMTSADDRDGEEIHNNGDSVQMAMLAFELQRRVYEMTVVKLRTAAPLTKSLRRREPPLLRTVLMFNTMRRIEKTYASAIAGIGDLTGCGVTSASALQTPILSPVTTANGGGDSMVLRTPVQHVSYAVPKDVEMDLLPSLPSEYLFSCSFDRLGTECYCQLHCDNAPSPSRLPHPVPPPSVTADQDVIVPSTAVDNDGHRGGLFPATSCGLIDDELPIITFSSVLDDFDPSSSSLTCDSATPSSTSPATMMMMTSGGLVADVATFDLTLDWPDFDPPAPLLPASSSPSPIMTDLNPELSPRLSVDFELDVDGRGVVVDRLPCLSLSSSGAAASCGHSVSSCNRRNDTLADELDHIVQQILVGT